MEYRDKYCRYDIYFVDHLCVSLLTLATIPNAIEAYSVTINFAINQRRIQKPKIFQIRKWIAIMQHRIVKQHFCSLSTIHTKTKNGTEKWVNNYSENETHHGGVERMSSGTSQPDDWSCSVVSVVEKQQIRLYLFHIAAGWTDWLSGCCLKYLRALCRHLTSLFTPMLCGCVPKMF